MEYGNITLSIYNEYKNLNKMFENTNYDKNLVLNYNEPNKEDVEKLFFFYNSVDENYKVKIAKDYDDPEKLFLKRFLDNNQNYTENIINKYIIYIKKVCNYYVMKYKLKFNAARPFQLANKYKINLYPVGLLSANTPSYPSGHAALYYSFYKFFSKIDPDNNYEDILHLGLKSRIISAIHFEQDNIASQKIVEQIFLNDLNLKMFN